MTTNLTALRLSTACIEARDIHSQDATAGDVLTADGDGGSSWAAPSTGGSGAVRCMAAGRNPQPGDQLQYLYPPPPEGPWGEAVITYAALVEDWSAPVTIGES